MSQSSTLTRCPHCDTRFRVTEEQLGIARGKVRCGNCMEVFNALEHSESGLEGGTPSSPPKQDTSTSTASGSRFQEEEELIFEDDPEEDAAEGNYAGTKTAFDEDELSDSFLNFDETRDHGFDDDEDALKSDVDESWAEAILNENESFRAPGKTQPQPEPDPEAELKSGLTDLPGASEEEPFSRRTRFDTPAPDQPAAGPGDAIAFEPSAPDFKRPAPAEPEQPTPPPAAKPHPDTDDAAEDEPLAATRRLGENTSPYGDLRSEPIAIAQDGGSWKRKTVWTLVVLLLVGGLVSQITYFQLDRLSSIPELRPYYETGCELLGCELPPLVAIDRIQSQKLVVRTDPSQRDTLVVDAVLVNQAGFEQPFPNIGLTFSNLNGDVVAQSLFEPDEYLSGEAEQMNMMPSRTPIRISIQIRDPGRDAVNYNLTFIAPAK
ncbi:DUF3426 domain-containing protein [Marinobacter sp. JSM 1782161]|uniref:DUF3426 domain-containing protein n=1 Tax=Marinobacter sp. JSM 1782161 TaxID=2685906 RepID=UPI001403F8A9|nr:DUF3426 domain-containing protein [Marinobacter sp. JSM 1782161]